mmetsp:Transcript_14425/g.36237  ORF Transcript_14425/g.36237 Transcript_14425/m.36237 type:complete len:200 (+) Transcript_14425:330-929(+)|eukprot:CAMPEP_0116102782 /NCGR_PEP_ID=MMETSP0327-20121206/13535_1 /TAXON_ID=44447 /ORGANISM="Pseudo-nitzschia delicatissima, Strain B596" /LENGTH=199 /DNA_ID=CAMNT_0003594849 /DNA_START=274 /DNA_END=873 /DNA_ORIENTATION=-
MVSTIRSSCEAVLFLLLTISCEGYQVPKRVAFYTPTQRSHACPKLYIGADFDSDLEAALGQAPLSEYERDAEFYRKRNEAYYKSLSKKNEEEVGSFSFSDGTHHEETKPEKENPEWVKDSVKASETSFRFVEETTFSLLKEKPMLALAIFSVTGLLIAYLSGFFFLEGYIEDWNPAENDMIPYWDDAEIHTIERAMPGE